MNGWFEFGGGVSCSPSVFSPALSCQHPCSGRRAFLSLLRNPATDSFLSAVRARIPVVRLYSHNFLVPADFLSTRRVVSLSVFWCVFFLSHPVSHSPPARVPRAALISLPVCLLRVCRCGISLRHSFTRSRARFPADSWYLKLSLISGLFHKPFMLRSSSRSPVSLPVVTRTLSVSPSLRLSSSPASLLSLPLLSPALSSSLLSPVSHSLSSQAVSLLSLVSLALSSPSLLLSPCAPFRFLRTPTGFMLTAGLSFSLFVLSSHGVPPFSASSSCARSCSHEAFVVLRRAVIAMAVFRPSRSLTPFAHPSHPVSFSSPCMLTRGFRYALPRFISAHTLPRKVRFVPPANVVHRSKIFPILFSPFSTDCSTCG